VARPPATTARKRYHHRIGNPIEFRFFNAVRTSEMVGLRWLVIDWNKRHMAILETMVTRERKDTKTHVARAVHLDSRAMDCLRAQHPLVKSLHSGNVFTLAVALNGGVAVEPENDTVFTDLGNGTTWMDGTGSLPVVLGPLSSKRWAPGTGRPASITTSA
jgi:integrase